MARALKTFQAHLGFYDTVVAAPSRAAALKAWGSRQNLFRDGQAKETRDPQAIAAATAKPGVVLRRPVGSNAAFSETPDLPKVPGRPKLKLVHPATGDVPPKKDVAQKKDVPQQERQRPPPDRKPIERAEKALAKLRDDEREAMAEMEARKAELDKDEQRLRGDFRRRREAAEKALAQARQAYQQALRRG
jgi:hypothetical protein